MIVCPSLANANDGNWQTARRWSAFLAGVCDVAVMREWDGNGADLMIALHARRSAASIAAFAAAGLPVALVLTGTDLYRDLDSDTTAQRSLALAARVVTLQERGPDRLAPEVHARTTVIFQSAPALSPGRPRLRTFDLALVGHLRAEKDPMTALRALARLDPRDPRHARLRLLHAGGDKDAGLAAVFRAAAASDARVRLCGALPHAATRQLIRRSRVLLLPSLMEGGANVLIEAVTAGVAVLASRIDGSVGMLGRDYPGYFPVGDDAALAALIARCQAEPAFLETLRAHGAARAPLFAPASERDAVHALVRALASGTGPHHDTTHAR